jgi:hypothetical protein
VCVSGEGEEAGDPVSESSGSGTENWRTSLSESQSVQETVVPPPPRSGTWAGWAEGGSARTTRRLGNLVGR